MGIQLSNMRISWGFHDQICWKWWEIFRIFQVWIQGYPSSFFPSANHWRDLFSPGSLHYTIYIYWKIDLVWPIGCSKTKHVPNLQPSQKLSTLTKMSALETTSSAPPPAFWHADVMGWLICYDWILLYIYIHHLEPPKTGKNKIYHRCFEDLWRPVVALQFIRESSFHNIFTCKVPTVFWCFMI